MTPGNTLHCSIDGQQINCSITADDDFKDPILCFSGMAPMIAVAGGTKVNAVGPYTEVKLPNLTRGVTHEFTLQYADGFTPANRAWLPAGPYLRHSQGITPLGIGPLGLLTHPDINQTAYEGLALLPQPHSWRPTADFVEVASFNTDNSAFQAVDALAGRQHLGTFVDVSNRHALPVRFNRQTLPDDAYQLNITTDHVEVTSGSYGGDFYAAISLLTLLTTHQRCLPCGQLEDTPRFSWRGQHLDCARHYYQPSTIEDLLDLMALLKLNRFHWHLTDDEAFRIEVDCLPELWQQTRLRVAR
ncbi:MAG: family 20 glycosylhydrolase [Pseudomonadota bacterium]